VEEDLMLAADTACIYLAEQLSPTVLHTAASPQQRVFCRIESVNHCGTAWNCSNIQESYSRPLSYHGHTTCSMATTSIYSFSDFRLSEINWSQTNLLAFLVSS